MERDKIINEITDCEQQLSKCRKELGDHMLEVHHGWLASTCHRCCNIQNGILGHGEQLRTLQHRLQQDQE